jgi:hypothetical protein
LKQSSGLHEPFPVEAAKAFIAAVREMRADNQVAETVGFYDINLMDAATGDVVYMVAKEMILPATCIMAPSRKRLRPGGASRAGSAERRQSSNRGLHGIHAVGILATDVCRAATEDAIDGRSFDDSRKNGSETLVPRPMRNRSEKVLNEILWSSVFRW